MNEIELELGVSSYFGPNFEIVCKRSLRRLVELPKDNDRIIIKAYKSPVHDSFEAEIIHDGTYPDIRIVDHPAIYFDIDFEVWAARHIRKGRRYFRVEYEG